MRVVFIATLLLQAGFCLSQTPEYVLQINLSPERKQMSVQGELKLPARPEQQDTIQVALSELIKDFRVEIVEPRAEKNPEVTKRFRSWMQPGWGQHTWSIKPKVAIPANTRVVMRFQYTYTGDQSGFILSASERCFFTAGITSAWYPQLEEYPRTDDGIALRGLRSVGMLEFVLPAGWNVYTAGKRELTNDAIRFRIDQPLFFSFAAAKYHTNEISEPAKVSVYQLQERDRQRMSDYITQAARVMLILSNEFGTYPHPQFAIAEVPPDDASRAGFAGASPDGLILATTDFMNQEFNTAYYGHELGHQWWGGLVRPEGPEARWILTEAMAQYGSLRAVEVLEGAAKAESYRRKGYPGYIQDQSGFGYLMLAAAGADVPLSKLPYSGSLPRWLADSKGFFVLDMLSREMSREKFSAALKAITSRYAGKRIRWTEFVQEVKKFSGQDLDWFFKQWFEQTGVPEWKHEWQQENRKLTLRIQQSPPYFRFPVDAHITGKNRETLVQQLRIEQKNGSWTWDVPFEIEKVEIDPHFKILSWTEDYKKEATALIPYTRATLLRNDGKNQEARKLLEEALQKLDSSDPYGVRFLLHFTLSQIFFDENEMERSRTQLELALRSPVKRAETLPWVYLHRAQIADKQNNAQLVCSSLKSVITADRSAPYKTGAAEHIGTLSEKYRCN